MMNTVKKFGIIALLVIAGFMFAACETLEGIGLVCDCGFGIGCDCTDCFCEFGLGCFCEDNIGNGDDPWLFYSD